MTAPRLRTYKCRGCGSKLYATKTCIDCSRDDALPFIDIADPAPGMVLPDPFPEMPDLTTFTPPPFGGIDHPGDTNE